MVPRRSARSGLRRSRRKYLRHPFHWLGRGNQLRTPETTRLRAVCCAFVEIITASRRGTSAKRPDCVKGRIIWQRFTRAVSNCRRNTAPGRRPRCGRTESSTWEAPGPAGPEGQVWCSPMGARRVLDDDAETHDGAPEVDGAVEIAHGEPEVRDPLQSGANAWSRVVICADGAVVVTATAVLPVSMPGRHSAGGAGSGSPGHRRHTRRR
jgi:hypothetical protein